MRTSRLLTSAIISCLLLPLCALAQIDPNQKQVVAEVAGDKLTLADLDQKESGKLLQARYQYYLNQRKALDQLVGDKLLEIDARGKNLTVDQVLEQYAYKDIQDPTDDQLRVYYEGLESDQSYEAVRAQILDHIRELRRSKAKAAYIQHLRTTSSVQVFLQPPSAQVNIEKAFVKGSRSSPVVLVEFADYECPYCQKINPQLKKLEADYTNQIAIAYKDLPLPMHHKAEKAAEAARCAGDQGKFWEMHDVLFASNLLQLDELKEHARVLKLDTGQFDQCLDNGVHTADVKNDLEEGKGLGLTGTPSFFINNHFISGAQDYDALRSIIDQELALQKRQGQTQVSKKQSPNGHVGSQ